MAAGKRTHKTQLEKYGKSDGKRYLVPRAHRNKIPTATPRFSGLTFSMAIIFMSLGIGVTPKINMAVENWKQLHLRDYTAKQNSVYIFIF